MGHVKSCQVMSSHVNGVRMAIAFIAKIRNMTLRPLRKAFEKLA